MVFHRRHKKSTVDVISLFFAATSSMDLSGNCSSNNWEMKLLSSASSSSSTPSTNTTLATPLATPTPVSPPILVDVQDFSTCCPTIAESSDMAAATFITSPPKSPVGGRVPRSGGYHSPFDMATSPDPYSSGMVMSASTVSVSVPAEKPRKLSRGSSIKSLFGGGGSKPPKTTPTCLSPTGGSPKRVPGASPSRSPNPNNANKQFLQVGSTDNDGSPPSIFFDEEAPLLLLIMYFQHFFLSWNKRRLQK